MTTLDYPEVSPNRAVAEAQLLRVWRTIELWLKAFAEPTSPDVPESIQLIVSDPGGRAIVGEWIRLFAQEIDLVRRARNSISHAQPINDDDLQSYLQYGNRVLSLLVHRLSREGFPPAR